MELFVLIFMFYVFGKLFGFALRAAWGMTRLIFTFLFLPFILVALVLGGLAYFSFPVLIVLGIILLAKKL